MRVTGGRFVGLRLISPKGPPIRTTLDHIRQAIFHILGNRIVGAKVLDLFSGSGALGIEAFSRGAAHVTFVDRSYFAIQAIQENLQLISEAIVREKAQQEVKPLTGQGPFQAQEILTPFYEVMRSDAAAAIRKLKRDPHAVFDVVLLDPPYGRGLARKSLNALAQYAIVCQSGLVVAEHDKRESLPPYVSGSPIHSERDTPKEGAPDSVVCRLKVVRRQRYGDTQLTIYLRQ